MPQVMHYIVAPGDTLWMIARRFGVSINDLIVANPGLENPDMLYPGQVLHIPIRRRSMFPIHPYRPKDPFWNPDYDHGWKD